MSGDGPTARRIQGDDERYPLRALITFGQGGVGDGEAGHGKDRNRKRFLIDACRIAVIGYTDRHLVGRGALSGRGGPSEFAGGWIDRRARGSVGCETEGQWVSIRIGGTGLESQGRTRQNRLVGKGVKDGR